MCCSDRIAPHKFVTRGAWETGLGAQGAWGTGLGAWGLGAWKTGLGAQGAWETGVVRIVALGDELMCLLS
jgi:hypothetical protein